MPASPRTLFVERWMRAPRRVGAVAPSGRGLSHGMAAAAAAGPGRRIIELGPGTGPITRALIAAGVDPADLLLIELDPAFSARLAAAHPAATLVRDDAGQLRRIARSAGWEGCDAIVSGLPLINLPWRFQMRIAASAAAVLGPDGVLVQFTYGPVSPIPPHMLLRLGLAGERVAWITANLPPASIWVYRRAA